MKRCLKYFALVFCCVVALPYRSPAPLIYTPGEGWRYETVGAETGWRKMVAADQLDVAQAAFEKKNYSLAETAAQRVVTTWPLSDSAPQAEYLLGRCYEAKGQDERAFKAYQKLLTKDAKSANYKEVMQREFEICNRFMNGERFRLWGYIPYFSSMDKTVAMYEDLIRNGPFSDVAAQAQMNIGRAREKQSRLFDNEPYIQAAQAYETAADRYHDRPKIASEALYREGMAYRKQALTAEYDQSTAGQAIATFQEFMTLYPDDSRVAEGEKIIASLKTEEARGNYQIARFYESGHRWKSALIYYNEVLIQDPKSPYAVTSLQRITALKKLTENSGR